MNLDTRASHQHSSNTYRKLTCGLLGMCVLALVGTTTSSAWACSCVVCNIGIWPKEGEIPANIPGFMWGRVAGPEDLATPDFTLTQADDPTQIIPLTVSPEGPWLFIVPEEPLEPGVSYRLNHRLPEQPTICSGLASASEETLYHAVEPAPLPEALGTLRVVDASTQEISVAASGPCFEMVQAATVRFEIDYTPESLPWRDLLVFSTTVDGRPWQYQSYACQPLTGLNRQGHDLAFSECSPEHRQRGLEQGTHTAVVEASLPGTDWRVFTDSVTFDLRCDEQPEGNRPDGMTPAGDTGITSPDADPTDAVESVDDTGIPHTDANQTDAVDDSVRPQDKENGGCAIHSAPPHRSRWPLCVVGFGCGVALVFRRRRSA